MNGCRGRALRVTPGHRHVQRPVELEDARAIAVPLQPAAVARREAGSCEPRNPARCEIEKDGSGRWQLVQRFDGPAGFDFAPERAEVGDESETGRPVESLDEIE